MNSDGFVRFWKAAFTENLSLKAMAFVFALGFFGYVHVREDIQQRTIPVSVISLPPENGGRELMTKIPPSIHITLRGSARSMTKLIQEGLAPVEIDLRDGSRTTVAFTRGMFVLPEDLEFVVADPPRLDLEWEDIITRQVPLQSSITGRPAEGHVVRGDPALEPLKVTVKGPVSLVEVLQFARLAPFDVTGLTEGRFSRRIALEPPPPQVRYLGSQAATVTVEITRRRSERIFRARPIEVVGPPHALIVPRTVDVTVIGPPEIVSELRDEQVVPQANLLATEQWSPDSSHGSATVTLKVPLGGAEATTQPPQVTVRW